MTKRILLDWQAIENISLGEKRILALTDVGALIFMACSDLYRSRSNWRYGDDELTDLQWDELGKAIGNAEYEIMSNLVGMIVPNVMASITGLNLLYCDGSSYLREDYPLLYEAIHPDFHIDADMFFVPDLRDKFPLGAGDNYPIGTTGGEENHVLSEAEMPTHTHETIPHAHSEIIAVSTVVNGGLEAPAASATPAPSTTGFETVVVQDAGSSEPHNNMPPFLAIRWAIVAG